MNELKKYKTHRFIFKRVMSKMIENLPITALYKLVNTYCNVTYYADDTVLILNSESTYRDYPTGIIKQKID